MRAHLVPSIRRLALPVLVVAVALTPAAIAGSGQEAVSGPTATASVSAKKLAKKANKRARRADKRARTAQRAVDAAVARLDELEAGRTVSAGDQEDLVVALDGTFKRIVDTTITLRRPSRVLASASVEFAADGLDDDRVACVLTDGPGGPPMSRTYVGDVLDGSLDRTWFSLHGSMLRPAGSYEVTLACRRDAGTVVSQGANLIVWAVAT